MRKLRGRLLAAAVVFGLVAGAGWPGAAVAGAAVSSGAGGRPGFGRAAAGGLVGSGGPVRARGAAGSGVAARSARVAGSGALARGLAAARRSGRRVEVVSLRTETKQVFANPAGTVTVVEYAQPVRVRRGGVWVGVNTALRVRADGTVAPAAAVGGLVLSGGGGGPLARLVDGGARVAVYWPWRLPAPVLAGDTAVYLGVLPGVDLRVRATVDGFAEVLVVWNRAAAADRRLASIRLGVAAAGGRVKATAAGGLAVVDRGGKAVFSAGRPVMWDSGGAGGGGRAAAVGPRAGGRAGVRTVPMRLRVGTGGVSVVPDGAMLTSPGTRFPVFIDPAVSLGLAAWGNVTASAPNQTMAQDPFRSEGAKAGYGCDSNGCYVYRSAFAFGLSGLYGKHILGATFGITMYHSWSCSNTPTELWLTSAIDVNSTTWNNLGWYGWLDTQWAEANCGGPAVWMVFSGGLAGQVQNGSNAGWPTITVGLKAPDETNVNQWKRFYANPVLSVTYNSFPYAPDTLTVDGKPCVTGAGRPYLADLTPALAAHVSDPDAGQLLGARFYGAPLGGSLAPWAGQDNLANGGFADVKVPAGTVADGGVYSFQAFATDYTDNSGWSGACEFGVDVTPPGSPTVSSSDYPSDQAFHGMAGVTGRFVFSPPAAHPEDVAAYLVGLNSCNQPTCATVVPTGPSAPSANYGPPDMDGYCKSLGYQGVSLDGATAYDWHCVSGATHASIDLVANCGWQFGPGVWQPQYQDFNDPYSWICWRATSDYSAAADFTPMLAGLNTLNVWARDKAGNLSNSGQPVTYSFLVHSPTGPAAQYPMSEGSGTTTADTTGHGNTATLTGGAIWTGTPCTVSGAVTSCNDTGRRGAGPALSFDGSTGFAATAGPLTAPDPANPATQVTVRTDRSFTVSAWLNPADVTAATWWPTAVSADGAHASAFFLRHSFAPNAVWVFTMVQSDADGAPLFNLMGTSPVQTGAWTHVAGSYDAATKTMRLYVNGVLEAQTTIPGTFAATGPLAIGRGKWSSALNHFWHGQVDDVRFDSRLLSDSEIAALANAPVLTGGWELGEGAGATAHDTSGATPALDGTLSGGTSWVPVDPADARPADGGLPPGTTAVSLDGATGVVNAPGNQLPFPVPIASPTATVYNGALHVMARAVGTNHVLDASCVTCDGSDWHFQDLGGVTDGGPSVAVYNGQLHIIVAGWSGGAPTVYQKYWNGSTWSDWQTILASADQPIATVYGGALHVTARATGTGNVMHAWCVTCDGSDWSFQNLGGIITGAPAVAAYNGQFHIFADGSDGTSLWHKYWNGGAWIDWQQVAGSQANPVATVYGGTLHVTARATGTGNVMDAWCVTCDGSDWSFQNLGGIITGAPAVAAYNGQFHIFADGSDGTSLWHKYWNGGAWIDWQPFAWSADQPAATAYSRQVHVIARDTDTSHGAHAWCGACDGSDWRLENTRSVDTARSFTVTAWVRLTGASITRPESVAGIDGAHVSGFVLGEDNSAGPARWRFEMHTADADNDVGDTAWSAAAPALGTWTHLAGVFDSETHMIKLYVDGTLVGTARHASTWTATGPFVIGREKWQDATNVNPWGGDVASVRVYSGVLSDQQIADLAGA